MKDLKAQIEREMSAKLKRFAKEDKAEDRKMIQSHESNFHGVKHRAMGGAIEGGPARGRLDRKGKGKKDKGKTVVNVVIGKPDDKPAMPMPPIAPSMMKPPMPPAAPPMPPAGGPPMPPPGAGPGGPPPMMRADGGRLGMTAGAGSGEGRLEKEALQKRKD